MMHTELLQSESAKTVKDTTVMNEVPQNINEEHSYACKSIYADSVECKNKKESKKSLQPSCDRVLRSRSNGLDKLGLKTETLVTRKESREIIQVILALDVA